MEKQENLMTMKEAGQSVGSMEIVVQLAVDSV